MNITKVKPGDAEAVRKIKPSLSNKTIKERLEKQAEGKVDFLLLEDNGQPVSFVLLKWEGKSTHPEYPDMEDLYTREEFRGKGYGTLLIKECEERARKKFFGKIGLAVNPNENPKAKVLYERLGYKHDGEKTYLDATYNGVEDWVIDLEKDLK